MPKKSRLEHRLEKYRLAVEDFYIDSSGNIESIDRTMFKLLKKYPENSVERLGACMWIAAIGEIKVIFGDLMNERLTLLYSRQRGYYSSIRFCMETIADLEYLFTHPKEVKNFMTNGNEIGREIDILKKTCADDKEFDMKFNKLMIEGKINSRITDRISQTLPGCLRDYSMLCLYSHPSMEGFRLYSDQGGTIDLLFQKITYLAFKILASYYRMLLKLNLLNSETDGLFNSIVFWSLDCYYQIIAIQNNYPKKTLNQDKINASIASINKWAHESNIGEKMYEL